MKVSELKTYESIGALVVVLDVEGRILYWNASCSALTGYSLDEIKGRRFRDFLLDDEIETVAPALEGGMCGEHSAQFSSYWITKSGARRWITWSSTSKRGSKGKVRYCVRTGIDQTDRKELEESLHNFTGLAAALMATFTDRDEALSSIARMVVEDFADCCILELASAGCRQSRMRVFHRDPARAELCAKLQALSIELARPCLLQPAAESPLPCLMSEVSTRDLASMAESPHHLELLRELDPRSLIAVPLLVRGQPVGTLVLVSARRSRRYEARDLRFAQEISARASVGIENARLHEEARRAMHDQREANEQMVKATIHAQELVEMAEAAKAQIEESERELRQMAEFRELFIGIVGHDLRNPLSSIGLSASLLLKHGHLDDRDAKNVTRIINGGQRMSRMITQLLDLTRARLGGGFPLDSKPTNLRHVCRTVVEEFEAPIEVDIEGDVTGTWDPDRLAELLSNLMGNAIEHAAPGTPMLVIAYPEGDDVVLAVSNQGNPIPDEILPSIFEPFRRAMQHEKSANGNLGLGLYIAKQIVISHGGTIDAYSGDGITTFVIRLPRNLPSENVVNLALVSKGRTG